MADKYGEWIVFKPQLNKHNLMLWFLPYLALIFGGLIIFFLIKKKKKKLIKETVLINRLVVFFYNEI